MIHFYTILKFDYRVYRDPGLSPWDVCLIILKRPWDQWTGLSSLIQLKAMCSTLLAWKAPIIIFSEHSKRQPRSPNPDTLYVEMQCFLTHKANFPILPPQKKSYQFKLETTILCLLMLQMRMWANWLQLAKEGSKAFPWNFHRWSVGKFILRRSVLFPTRNSFVLKQYLTAHFHISPSFGKVEGYGEGPPLVPHTSEMNKQVNKRVEIAVDTTPW